MKPEKILLVDDDAISLQVISRILKQADYEYLIAENGEQAWEMLQQFPQKFNLVIADRIMPKLHGVDLLKKMRQHTTLKTIPLILLTGEAEKQEVIEAIKAGVADFLYKPVEEQLLLAVLKRVLKNQ